MDFTGRIAIITGGTGALGAAAVHAFASSGAAVVVPYRDEGSFGRLCEALGDLATRVEGRRTDVTGAAAVAALVADVIGRHGRIDFLLNLVGGYEGGRFADTDLAQWDRMLALNLRSALVCTHAVLPHLIERGSGRIITIGARSALEPPAGSSAYAASKAAVGAMTQAVAREIRTTGVTINCVAPSTIDTEANRQQLPKADPSRWVQPGDVAALLAYLCSDAAGAINGAVIPIYGQV